MPVKVIHVDKNGHLDKHFVVLHESSGDEVVWQSDETTFTIDFHGHNPFTTPDPDLATPRYAHNSGPIRGGAGIYRYHVHEVQTVHERALKANLKVFGPPVKTAKASTRSGDGEVIIYP